MRIRYGNTRFVLLWGDTAYKIARVRPLRTLARIIIELPQPRRRGRFVAKYGPGLVHALQHDLLVGIFANRREFDYWQQHRDPRVMPTTRSYWGGLVVTQPRGLPLTSTACSVCGTESFLPEELRALEIVKARQFCLDPATLNLLLIDYGKESTVLALEATRLAA